jgi:topoisomerase-4 subunit A
MALRREYDELLRERAGLEDLLASETLQWKRISAELAEVDAKFGRTAPGGARRSRFAEAQAVEDVPLEAMIEREPVTVVCSVMGWVRALKGHVADASGLKYRDGDSGRFVIHAETTDKLILFGSNGRAYTLVAANLPGGRGLGEPVRLMVDLPNEAQILTLTVHRPEGKLLVASSAGDGFVVPEVELVAQTRAGKQVLNLSGGAVAQVCRPVAGDHVAAVGENRKMLVFPLAELPEMARGKGVRLQRYKDGGLSDAITFALAEGLRWQDPAGRTRSETDLSEWQGARAGAGRMAPRGFPRDNRFP